MRSPRIVLCVASAIALASCGGSGESSGVRTGYYRGTMTIPDFGFGSGGTGQVVADVGPNGQLSIMASPEMQAGLAWDGTMGTLLWRGVFNGLLTESFRGRDLTFDLHDNAISLASGTLSPANLPTLGSVASAPPIGNYQGEALVVSNGHVVAYATVRSEVDSSGLWYAQLNGALPWLSDVAGRFGLNGKIEEGLVLVSGTLMSQMGSPCYSFDGTTLVARYDELALTPGSVWLTLRQGGPGLD